MAVADLGGGRVERVLDTASELLVRWGYQRVTIEEVARHSGIGKGTVYLHFRTKDALFLTVLLRAQRRIVERMADAMTADAQQVLPARVTRTLYLELNADPIARTLYFGDAEVLGRLAHEAAETLGELAGRRDEAVNRHLRLLQDAGCLRSDLPIEALRYTFSAIATGFFLLDGLHLPGPPLQVAMRADLLEHTVAAAVQVPEPPADSLERVAPVVADLYRGLLEHIDNEWRRRVR